MIRYLEALRLLAACRGLLGGAWRDAHGMKGAMRS
jgi:hypothetical protein